MKDTRAGDKYIKVTVLIDSKQKDVHRLLTYFYKESVNEAVVDYLNDATNKDILASLGIIPDQDGKYSKQDLARLIEILTEQLKPTAAVSSAIIDDETKKNLAPKYNQEITDQILKARTKIFNAAALAFKSKMKKIQILPGLRTVMSVGTSLRVFEQQDIRNLNPRYYTLGQDVAVKLVLNDPRMLKLLHAIIKFGDVSDFEDEDKRPDYGDIGLFTALHILQKYINVDRSYKRALKIANVESIEIDPKTNTTVFKISGEKYSMFDLLFLYNVNIETITETMTAIAKKDGSNQVAMDAILEKLTTIRAEYDSLLDTWGSILSHNTFDMSKEDYINRYKKDNSKKAILQQQKNELLTDFNTTAYNQCAERNIQ